jgi:hypothetical protein
MLFKPGAIFKSSINTHYEVRKKIGKGAFGHVYEVVKINVNGINVDKKR